MFFKIDLRSRYHQLRIKPKGISKITFRIGYGHYKFMVMPFGLTNVVVTFIHLINGVFKPHLDKFVLVFIYEIFIYSIDSDVHTFHLRIVW